MRAYANVKDVVIAVELQANCTDWKANIKGKYDVGFRYLKLRRIRFEKIGQKKITFDAPSYGITTDILERAAEATLSSYFSEAFLNRCLLSGCDVKLPILKVPVLRVNAKREEFEKFFEKTTVPKLTYKWLVKTMICPM